MDTMEAFILTIVFKNGFIRTYDMASSDALDSALSQFLDNYPRPESIALSLKSEWGIKSADVATEHIIALEYERPPILPEYEA